LPDGVIIDANALLRHFGYQNGMLLVDDFDKIRRHTGTLVAMGYGFSTLGPYAADAPYNLDGIKEMLADWTWSGPADKRPYWLTHHD
jgi:hypothetical protein